MSRQIPNAPSPNVPSQNDINALLRLFNARRFPDAITAAQGLIRRFPEDGAAWSVLGVSLINIGRHADALAPMERAAALLPRDASVRYNLGLVQARLGRLAEAEKNYQAAFKRNPKFVEAGNALGDVLRDQGRLQDAVRTYLAVLKINPRYLQALNGLGIAFAGLGKGADAVAQFRQALKIDPKHLPSHNNLGNAYADMARWDQAEACFAEALRIDPGYLPARFSLANAALAQGRLDIAEAGYREILQGQPNHALAHFHLAEVLKRAGRMDEAEASYREALRSHPGYAEAHNNLGALLQDLNRLSEAEASLRAALKLHPDYAKALNNLGNVLAATGRLDEAEASYRRAIAIEPTFFDAYGNLLFLLNHKPGADPEQALDEARRFGRAVAKQVPRRFRDWTCDKEASRLRIGLVSGDLRNHPVGYFLEAILGQIDPSAFELIAYSTAVSGDELTERIKPYFTEWHSLAGLEDEAAAKQIHGDGVHILIDLSGHTAGNRLPIFAWKPAPVQVSWLGYFATTGLAEMDYLIADPWTLPESEERHFTETVWRLPETRLCFTPPAEDVEVSPLPAEANGYITFGCFNNLTKVGDEVVATWANILERLPDSRLFLKCKQLDDASERQRIVERFEQRGVSSERLLLEGVSPRKEYLAAHHRVDIALDPFPYPGGTTSAEALWMGVPVLTMAGESFLERQGVGIVENAGLSDWVAGAADEYIDLAVRHAQDLTTLAQLRQGLRQQVLASPLFDAERFAGNLETALKDMWSVMKL